MGATDGELESVKAIAMTVVAMKARMIQEAALASLPPRETVERGAPKDAASSSEAACST